VGPTTLAAEILDPGPFFWGIQYALMSSSMSSITSDLAEAAEYPGSLREIKSLSVSKTKIIPNTVVSVLSPPMVMAWDKSIQ